ncbi:DUF262 domain-containing protein [Desulfosediminicola flagellatus]|uniref:DUF262 domain-containing protein n=1 Tax=Desulfosediminicola flagellatus TaxID=2569541 RepID=UPI0010AC8EEC|nr:DUF262 domain-containing protein [Desulfosediminicola flagellatus]
MSLNFTMEPRVSFLTELLKEIDNCSLQIPRFQREYVWVWDQQRDLLCSIYEGLPIGSILVWSTKLANVKSHNQIGPFKLKEIDQETYSKMFIMDGLQRMTTLYATLFHPVGDDYDSLEGTDDYFIYCDLDADDIQSLFVRKIDIKNFGINDSGNFMPLRYVFDTKAFLKFQRQLPEDREDWIDKADEIVAVFKNYKIPVIPLESNEISLVTKSFERINTRGTVMSETHMLNALSYSDRFDLLKIISEYQESYLGEVEGWGEVDKDFILSLIKMELGFDIYFKNTDVVAENLNQKIVQKVFCAIKDFIAFSNEILNLNNAKLFPYKLQMYGLGYSFLQSEPLPNDVLKAWYIITTYTGAFGATARNSSYSLEDLKRYIQNKEFKWTLNIQPQVNVWRENVGFRSARMKAWGFALANKQDSTLQNRNSALNLITSYRGKYFRKPLELKTVSSKRPGHHFLIPPEKVKSFSIISLSEIEREAHFINDLLIDYLLSDDFDSFANEREDLIFNWELQNIVKPAAHLLGLKNITYNG